MTESMLREDLEVTEVLLQVRGTVSCVSKGTTDGPPTLNRDGSHRIDWEVVTTGVDV